MNRFIVRNINFAFNASLVDAVVRSTKIQDVFRPDAVPHPWTDTGEADVATPKQVEYIRQLAQVLDESSREHIESQLSELTKSEASKMIESFRHGPTI